MNNMTLIVFHNEGSDPTSRRFSNTNPNCQSQLSNRTMTTHVVISRPVESLVAQDQDDTMIITEHAHLNTVLTPSGTT